MFRVIFWIVDLAIRGLLMNWSVYDDSLVRRSEVLLDFSILDGWNCEVKLMSAGKRGRLFSIQTL